jgi:hypothetical protein
MKISETDRKDILKTIEDKLYEWLQYY